MPELAEQGVGEVQVSQGGMTVNEVTAPLMQYTQYPHVRNFVRLLTQTLQWHPDGQSTMDPGLFRPMLGRDGKSYVELMNFRGVKDTVWDVTNEGFSAILPRDAWIKYDSAIRRVARDRLRFVGDIMGAGLTYSANLFGKTQLSYRTASDAGEAIMGMDPMMRGKADRPVLDAEFLPLPLIWCDYWFSSRDIAVSHSGDFPVDTQMAENASRRVAEKVEDLHIGNIATYQFGGSKLQGALNWDYRQTKTLTHPSAAGWTPQLLITELLEARDLGRADKRYGPWGIFTSPGWDLYLDQDYSDAKGDDTVRERIMKIGNANNSGNFNNGNNFSFIRSLDRLADWKVLIVDMSSETLRTVIGMPMQNFQWQLDPWSITFRVMTMQLPQFFKDFNDNVGIIHCTATP